MENQGDDEASRADLWVAHLVDDTTEQAIDDAAAAAAAAAAAVNGGREGAADFVEDADSKPGGGPAKDSVATVAVGERGIKF